MNAEEIAATFPPEVIQAALEIQSFFNVEERGR
jgi:hypothetical protein